MASPNTIGLTFVLIFNIFFSGLLSVYVGGWADTFKKTYNTTTEIVNLTYTSYLFALVIAGIPINFVIHRFSSKWLFCITLLTYTLGGVLRLLVDENIYFMHAGLFLSGLGAPVTFNCIYSFCNSNFTKKTALVLMSICNIFDPVGTMVGLLLPFLFIEDGWTDQHVKKGLQRYQFMLLALFAIALIASVLLLRGEGREPVDQAGDKEVGLAINQNPSLAITNKMSLIEKPKVDICRQYRILFSDPVYISMMLSSGLMFGSLGTIGGCLVQEVVIWGMDEKIGSYLAAYSVLIGLFGSIFYSLILSEVRSQLMMSFIFQAISLGSCGLACYSMTQKNQLMMYLATGIYALTTYPAFMILIDQIGKLVGKSMELTGTSAVYSLSSIIMGTSLFFIGLIIKDETEDQSVISFIVIGSMMVLSVVFNLFAVILKRSKTPRIEWDRASGGKIAKTVLSDGDRVN